MNKNYYRPKTISDAVEILNEHGSRLKMIAGCTDISVARQEKMLNCISFLDLSYIDELKGICEADGYIHIGAMTTHRDISRSELVHKSGDVLAQAVATIGSPLIRNLATIGGNISHASPSGDSIPPLMVLNGEFCLTKTSSQRWIPATKYFTGPGKTIRADDELLTAIRFRPTAGDYFHLWQKLGQRKALACSKASMAFVALLKDGVISDARIACGAVAPTVVRCPGTQEFLEGRKLDNETVDRAVQLVMTEVKPIDDLRSTGEYRTHAVGCLLDKALRSLGG